MKSSALRTWLRRERAVKLAHRHRLAAGIVMEHWMRDLPMATRALREPRADVHIHGRDCDWEDWKRWRVTQYIPVLKEWTAPRRATCGVDGEYPA